MRNRTGSDHPRENGWALVTVLWIVMALSLIAAATEALTFNTYRLQRHALEKAQIDAALSAGIVRAVMGIEAPDINDRWRVDGISKEWEFDDIKLTISIQDELGRFDLNAVDASVLSTLLKAQNLPRDEVDTLTDRILDWRSPNDLHRLHGATDADYAAAGLTYHPRHGPYQSVDEVQLVLGMTKDIFEKIRPALTVYTKKPTIDPAHAPREALLALYGGNEDAVDQVIAARTNANGPVGIADPAISLLGRTFSIEAETKIATNIYRRAAVVMITGDQKRPYLTLAWK